MGNLIDLTGKRFGRLTVAGRAQNRENSPIVRWKCLCDCGKEIVTDGALLRKGSTKSCGCIRQEMMSTHSESYTRLYRTWRHMKERCQNSACKSYRNYGGRGILVCNEWNSFEEFRDWALKNGYEDTLSIDRIDVNQGYNPNNCRWASDKVQGNNRRNNRVISYKGKCKTVAQWSDELNIPYDTLKARIDRGWDVGRALKCREVY